MAKLECYRLSQRIWRENARVLKHELLKTDKMLDGHTMSKGDNFRYSMTLYLYAYLIRDAFSTLDNDYRERFGRRCSDVSILNWIGHIATCDAGIVQSQLKQVLLLLRRIPHKGMTKKEWKRALSDFDVMVGEGCPFNGADPILQPLQYCMLHPEEPRIYRVLWYVNTVLQFTTRLTLQDVDWILDENIQDYLDLEEAMKTQEYDPQIVKMLRDIVDEWFSDFSLSGESDSHGYGATADVKRSAGTHCKYKSIMTTQHEHHWRVIKSLGVTPHRKLYSNAVDAYCMAIRSVLPEHLYAKNRVSIAQFVAKGINKKRLISMEDTANQFYQKIIFGELDRHFQRHPEMHIDLHDQSKSRRLAWLGSLTGKYGTFDLSSASDTVTWSLVKEVFAGQPLLLKLMEDTRTTKTYFKDLDLTVELEKAFPMGSALCFPIECVIFSAVIALALRLLGIHSDYQVYGDDMIIPLNSAGLIALLLDKLHFKLNRDKSYCPGSAFTEACGGEYFLGHSIVPIRVSRKLDVYKWYVKATKTQQLEALQDLANQAKSHCLMGLRKAVIDLAYDRIDRVYFVHDDEDGWHSDDPTNDNYKVVFRREPLHCMRTAHLTSEQKARFLNANKWQGTLSQHVQRVSSHFVEYRYVPSLEGTEDYPQSAAFYEQESLRLERWFECRSTQYAKVWDTYQDLCSGHPYDPKLIDLCRMQMSTVETPSVGVAKTTYRWQWLPVSV